METIFSTAYFPNIEYFSRLAKLDNLLIEKCENFTKQTYRNRCAIYGSNGQVNLSIPVVKVHNSKTAIKDLKISYVEDWQKQHLRSIDSAYNSSPFYDYFRDEFLPFFEKKEKYLFDLNCKITELLLELLQIDATIQTSKEYHSTYAHDFRSTISPKLKSQLEFKEYHQVFSDKHGFIANLSIIDLLCNQGNNALSYIL